jgi:hypothetical protein
MRHHLFHPDYTVGFGISPNPAATVNANGLPVYLRLCHESPLVGCTTDREFLSSAGCVTQITLPRGCIQLCANSINNAAVRQIGALVFMIAPRHEHAFQKGDRDVHAEVHENQCQNAREQQRRIELPAREIQQKPDAAVRPK